jgi:hypothetical protein
MKNKIWLITIIITILLAILFFIKFDNKSKINSDLAVTGIDQEQNSLEEVVDPEIKKVNDSLNTYFHKKYNFTFEYPSTFKTSNFIEGSGEQIQFQGNSGDWFQIYVTPWDEGSTVTPERIKKDLPNIVIKEPQQVVLGPKQKEGVGPRALIFFSKDGSIGDTREIWFVENSYLFQITTQKRLDTVVGGILATLVFK